MQTWIKANIGKLIARFGGMKLLKISKPDYEALDPKDPDTLYTVIDGDDVTQYFGEIELKNGSGSAGTLISIYNGTTSTTAGTLTAETLTEVEKQLKPGRRTRKHNNGTTSTTAETLTEEV